MKRVHTFIAIGAGLMAAAAAGVAVTSRAAEAAGGSGFARPNYELAREGAMDERAGESTSTGRHRDGSA